MQITDRVRDLMVLTVPGLKEDELESLVEPDVPMEDDGCTDAFARAFIYDDLPTVEVEDDLAAVMRLTDPLLGGFADLPVAETAAVLFDDGLEQAWFDAMRYVVPEFPVSIAAPVAAVMIAAPAGSLSICAAAASASISAPAAVPAIAPASPVLSIGAASAPVGETVETPSAEEAEASPAMREASGSVVSFSFGPSSADIGGWKVVFSFRPRGGRMHPAPGLRPRGIYRAPRLVPASGLYTD